MQDAVSTPTSCLCELHMMCDEQRFVPALRALYSCKDHPDFRKLPFEKARSL